MTRPHALILDYGEVLSHPMRAGAIELIASQLDAPPSEMASTYWRYRREYDLGLPASEYWQLVAQDLGVPFDEGLLGSLVAIDVDSWTHYRDEMWALVAEYRQAGGRLAMLSNGVPEIVARIRADHDLARLFDAVVVSCEVQLAKPQPDIYHLTLDRLGLEPAQALFVDDREENVEAARALGLPAFRFTGDIETLRRQI